MLWGEEKAHSNTLTHTQKERKNNGEGLDNLWCFLELATAKCYHHHLTPPSLGYNSWK